MEIRKVQKTGTSTLTVSLPKPWAEEHKLEPGDPVEMEVLSDGSLSLTTVIGNKEEHRKKTIRVKNGDSGPHLMRKLIGTYLAGFDVIEIVAKERLDFELKKKIKEFTKIIIGPEVIDETSTAITLHDLSDPGELPQKKCLRRMYRLVTSMHSDAMTAFGTGDECLAKDVIERDLDVDRLYMMVVKQYNMILKNRKLGKRIGSDIQEGVYLMLAARLIERIGDHAEKIARNSLSEFAESDEGIVSKMEDLSTRALSVLKKCTDAMFRRDVDDANSAIDEGNAVVEDCEEFKANIEVPGAAGVIDNAVLDSIIRTTMYSMNIGETAIDLSMR